MGYSCPLWYIDPVNSTIEIVSRTVSVSVILIELCLMVETNIPKTPCTARNNNHLENSQERMRFYILGGRKVRKNVLLKVDRCSLVPNNLLKSFLVP